MTSKARWIGAVAVSLAAVVTAAGATRVRAAEPAPADSSYTIKGGQDRTDLKSLTVEGEDRVHFEVERPALTLSLDPTQVAGLLSGDARDVLDRVPPDLTTAYIASSAAERSPYTGRPWLGQFASGAVARFHPDVKGIDRWRLVVADSRGQAVRAFEGNGTPPKEIVWDGRAMDGSFVTPGVTYSYVFEAKDKAGNKRNFVGDGFRVSAYRLETPEGPALVFSGLELAAAGGSGLYGGATASRGTPPCSWRRPRGSISRRTSPVWSASPRRRDRRSARPRWRSRSAPPWRRIRSATRPESRRSRRSRPRPRTAGRCGSRWPGQRRPSRRSPRRSRPLPRRRRRARQRNRARSLRNKIAVGYNSSPPSGRGGPPLRGRHPRPGHFGVVLEVEFIQYIGMNTPIAPSQPKKERAGVPGGAELTPRGPGRHTAQEVLQRVARETIAPSRLVIASHREPYQHVRRDGTIRVIRSAGGLASALDSVARATGATWVALASGDADRETVDAKGRVAMPPADPRYTLQRIWVDSDETLEAYRRFANGCLWPLCHVVYVRPTFDRDQWEAYREVNRRFADAILDAIGDEPATVLLQDYQLALTARMLRERRPDLSLVLFWHIPWPNAEVFRILPWKHDILDGLLATDLIGFHINNHGFNFMDTVARELEVHVDRERSALKRKGHRTYVRSYPIAPDALEIARTAADPESKRAAAERRREMGIGSAKVILGVDRLDYTKGIPERLDAFERLLEQRLPGSDDVVMIQIGVPSRVDLPDYQALAADVEARVARINERFGGPGSPVIHLLVGNLGFDDLIPYYVLGDVMAVTSLHDGMNLVAKEYVAARIEDDGVLVLSPYTGASRELEHAIHASPYDVDGLARALSRALTLDREGQRVRMRALREVVTSHNIYDWGRALLRDIRRLHLTPGARVAREVV